MHQVIPDSREPCAMVAAREVDVDKPLQTCAARRAEKQQCVEHRFVDEEPKEFLNPAIQMVEIHAEHTRVLHERGVAAVGENAGRRHVVEVLPLVATSLVSHLLEIGFLKKLIRTSAAFQLAADCVGLFFASILFLRFVDEGLPTCTNGLRYSGSDFTLSVPKARARLCPRCRILMRS